MVFANEYDEFANYDKEISSDLYKDLGYTYRDVFDELAQVTASTICLNDNNDLEIRYITETNDVIDEEYFKDVNHVFIWHGRYTCTARNPKCSECTVKDFCKSYKKQSI